MSEKHCGKVRQTIAARLAAFFAAGTVLLVLAIFGGSAASADPIEGSVMGTVTLQCSPEGTVEVVATASNVSDSGTGVDVSVSAFGQTVTKTVPPNEAKDFVLDSGSGGVDPGSVGFEVGTSSGQVFYPKRTCPFAAWTSLPLELYYSVEPTVEPTEPTETTGFTTSSEATTSSESSEEPSSSPALPDPTTVKPTPTVDTTPSEDMSPTSLTSETLASPSTVTQRDTLTAVVTGSAGSTGFQGPQGNLGPQGPQGEAGAVVVAQGEVEYDNTYVVSSSGEEYFFASAGNTADEPPVHAMNWKQIAALIVTLVVVVIVLASGVRRVYPVRNGAHR